MKCSIARIAASLLVRPSGSRISSAAHPVQIEGAPISASIGAMSAPAAIAIG